MENVFNVLQIAKIVLDKTQHQVIALNATQVIFFMEVNATLSQPILPIIVI